MGLLTARPAPGSEPDPTRPADRAGILDRQLLAWSAACSLVILVGYGLVAAIIPNPVFGRGIAPEPFAIVVWLVTAPLMGMLAATYLARPRHAAAALLTRDRTGSEGTTLGSVGALAAFLAIGCPTCNKIALLLLGASGAVTVFGPVQPFIGAASLAMLLGSLAWRLRLRARGGACAR